MMRAILNLFGRSPFAPLMTHMDLVNACVSKVPDLFQGLDTGDQAAIERVALETSKIEHEADLAKQDIRNHLPNSVILPVDRSSLLEVLTLQDHIADSAEDVGVLLTLRPIDMIPEFRDDLFCFMDKNLESFQGARAIILELESLIQCSFGQAEVDRVRQMVTHVAHSEHEADLIQRRLLKHLFSIGDKMPVPVFHIWLKVLEKLGDISNLSEKLSYRVRTMLEIAN